MTKTLNKITKQLEDMERELLGYISLEVDILVTDKLYVRTDRITDFAFFVVCPQVEDDLNK